jgi:hypothetical protein
MADERRTATLGRTARITIRLTPEDARRLASVAWDQHRSQTDVVESLIRSLAQPEEPAPNRYEALLVEQQALIKESNRLLARIAAACERR